MRTDLFFGGKTVGAKAWRQFVATVVTPRFPDGLTVFDARGQWRGRGGILREPTRVLVIYHRDDAASGARIEATRKIYRRRYEQARYCAPTASPASASDEALLGSGLGSDQGLANASI